MNRVFWSDTYVDPEKYETDLIYLNDDLNPLRRFGVEAAVKVLYQCGLPGKIIPVQEIEKDSIARGEFDHKRTYLESSSGSTAVAVAYEALRCGRKAVIIVPRNLEPGKLLPIKMAGAKIIFPEEGQDEIKLAEELAQDSEVLYFNQYFNEANCLGHERVTGEQIIRQTEGRVSLISCAVGTAGTRGGCKRAVVKHGLKTEVIGVICAPGEKIRGMRDRARLEHTGLDWKSADFIYETNTLDAYATAVRMNQGRVPVCGSVGGAWYGALAYIRKRMEEGTWNELRNEDGKILTVIPAIDSMAPYWETAYEVLKKAGMDDFSQLGPVLLPDPAP